MVKIHVKDYGIIEIKLDKVHAPESCNNFLSLAESGFYNGLQFHRVIEDFVIQGGDPNNDCTGGPGYSIKGEFKSNGVDNPNKHLKGAISMARSSNPNSAGSQFFICHKAQPRLDDDYAVFGYVVNGSKVVDQIAKTRTNRYDQPLVPVIIEKIELVDEVVEDFTKLEAR